MNNQIGKQELFHPDLGQPDTAPNQELDQTAKSLAPIVKELKSLNDKADDNETASQKLALIKRANAKMDAMLEKANPGQEKSYLETIDLEKFDEKVMDFMERLYDVIPDKDYIALGLAGLDSDRAWSMREELLVEGAGKAYTAKSLAGLDSDRAWSMREKLLVEGAGKAYTAKSLAGLDSDKAWAMREKLLIEGAIAENIALSLAGLDSDRAWAMREEVVTKGADKDIIALSLAGLDSDRAWAMREELLSGARDIYNYAIVRSLAGLDSDRAWDYREQYLSEGKDLNILAFSLSGNVTTFVWRLIAKRKQEEAKKKKQ